MVNWKEHFYYDSTSRTHLRWNRDVYGGVSNNRIKVMSVGDVAGWVSGNGYAEVKLGGSTYKIHRIIYEMHAGEIPEGMDIDHEDGVRLNNLVGNLRLATDKLNSQNRKKRSDNTSGTTGVNWMDNGCGKTYWLCRWTEDGKERSKSFNIEDRGSEVAYAEAVKHRLAMLDILNANGENYTERHGK